MELWQIAITGFLAASGAFFFVLARCFYLEGKKR